MIFVPSKNGQSHSPAEWTAWSDIEAGANLMLQTVLDLHDGQPGDSKALNDTETNADHER